MILDVHQKRTNIQTVVDEPEAVSLTLDHVENKQRSVGGGISCVLKFAKIFNQTPLVTSNLRFGICHVH